MNPTPTRSGQRWLIAATLVASFATGGCAAFNRAEIVLARNISFGQELIDLQRARDEGAITEKEYRLIKEKVMALIDQAEIAGDVPSYLHEIDDGDED